MRTDYRLNSCKVGNSLLRDGLAVGCMQDFEHKPDVIQIAIAPVCVGANDVPALPE